MRSKNVISRANPNGTVDTMRLDDENWFYTIDGIAAEFWLMIDNRSSVESIKKKLQKKHAPPEDRFNKDITKFLKFLDKSKLITISKK